MKRVWKCQWSKSGSFLHWRNREQWGHWPENSELKYRGVTLAAPCWTSGAPSHRGYFSDKQKLSGCPHVIVYMCAHGWNELPILVLYVIWSHTLLLINLIQSLQFAITADQKIIECGLGYFIAYFLLCVEGVFLNENN